MTFDIVLAGVGGQGVLSAASIIALAAMEAGLYVKQSEVHGMAQRGGSVVAHLRLADRPIASSLVAVGAADLVLASELLEAARQRHYLAPSGVCVAASTEVRAMEGYPETDYLIAELEAAGTLELVDAEAVARDAGTARAATTVLIGAASRFLPIPFERLEAAVAAQFSGKSDRVIDANIAALAAGCSCMVPLAAAAREATGGY